ncbi:MAG: DUF512 domain-containing protein [Actinobacteria bacterium]|nr:DUF512 domain-containing protein [Actinomycetota bacterium]
MSDPADPGAVVASVDDGAARTAGIRPGDVVLTVDGQAPEDVIDWMWLTDDPTFTVGVLRGADRHDLTVRRRSGEPLGVTFVSPLFTPVRQCENACAFCFVSGVPAGLRPSLYVRDDDFRLSFLSGNFITLTNTTEEDVERIVAQRLSPLHVSVHSVDPAVRSHLMCPTVEDRALEILDTLLARGIEAHVQIVLVPGVNDAAVLEETLEYLYAREGVLSVGTVPMGFTAHQSRFTASFGPETAEGTLAQIAAWQERARAGRGVGWVYAADELYLAAARELPSAGEYDGFPQYENGIGMTAAFLDEFAPAGPHRSATLVTGELFAPVLVDAMAHAGWSDVGVLPVANRLFGGNVCVTGLLCGADIVAAITADGGSGVYLVPDVVVNSDGLLLDDMRAEELAQSAGVQVRFIGSDAASLTAALAVR